jgi:phospholipid/cholesterol/gamma-HCH transport system substrate-binding protein
MEKRPGEQRIHPGWWALMLVAFTAVFLFVTSAIFLGTLKTSVPVTLTSDRSGIIMETNAKVKMRGVEVGRVSHVGTAKDGARLTLAIEPDQIRYIPANVEAEIDVTTAFGAKFVDLVSPENPSKQRLAAGAVLHSKNVATEVNTVFENVVELLKMIDPAKLNAVLTAVADAVRGQGERIGQATTDLNQVVTALNDRSELIRQAWRSFKHFNDTTPQPLNILTVTDAASTTSATVAIIRRPWTPLLRHRFSNAGTNLLVTSKDSPSHRQRLEPTTNLLLKYSPTYTLLAAGPVNNLKNGAKPVMAAGTFQFDVALLGDPYVYPDTADCRGQGPGRQPGCGSLPTFRKTSRCASSSRAWWGTGVDIRPNPASDRAAAGSGDPRRAGGAHHPPVPRQPNGPVPSGCAATRRAATGRAGCRCGRVAAGRANGPAQPAGTVRRLVTADELRAGGFS